MTETDTIPTVDGVGGEFTLPTSGNTDARLSFLDVSYRPLSETLFSMRPLLTHSADRHHTVNDEIVGLMGSGSADLAAMDEPSLSRSAEASFSGFIFNALSTLSQLIIPTASAQEVRQVEGRKEWDSVERPDATLAGETICIDGDGNDVGACGAGRGFTLPANSTVTIKFRATIGNPLATPATQVCNRGTIIYTGGPGGGY